MASTVCTRGNAKILLQSYSVNVLVRETEGPARYKIFQAEISKIDDPLRDKSSRTLIQVAFCLSSLIQNSCVSPE
jgi:hypothetical protein